MYGQKNHLGSSSTSPPQCRCHNSVYVLRAPRSVCPNFFSLQCVLYECRPVVIERQSQLEFLNSSRRRNPNNGSSKKIVFVALARTTTIRSDRKCDYMCSGGSGCVLYALSNAPHPTITIYEIDYEQMKMTDTYG